MRLRPLAPVLLASALTASVAVALPTASGAATPPVKIYKVQYDSPGSDSGSNTSLNTEWVMLKNTTSTNRSLTGWTLKDKTGYTYRSRAVPRPRSATTTAPGTSGTTPATPPTCATATAT